MRRVLRILMAVIGLGLTLSDAVAQGTVQFERSELTIETRAGQRHPFKVELAITSDQQAQGLMFRRILPQDHGMLFVNPAEREIAMWMKNTFIPLDMIFIRATGEIARIAQRTTPQSLATVSSEGPALAVLEVPGGTADRLGLAPGDRVLHPAFPR